MFLSHEVDKVIWQRYSRADVRSKRQPSNLFKVPKLLSRHLLLDKLYETFPSQNLTVVLEGVGNSTVEPLMCDFFFSANVLPEKNKAH